MNTKPPITLATLPQATSQEVFDQCAPHLLTQGEKSKNEQTDSCAYRGDRGLKCVAGCLIGNKEYNRTKMEGKNWNKLVEAGTVPKAHEFLIADLQYIHDFTREETWKKQLQDLAIKWKFDTSVLNEFQNQ